MGCCSHIDRELAADPDQLPRVRLQFRDAARVRLPDIDGIASERVDDLKVLTEHVRVLVILGVDVLSDGRGEGDLGGLAERER